MIILILFIYLFIYLFICLFYFYSLFVPFLQSTRFCDCASSLFYNCIGFVFLYDAECLQFAICDHILMITAKEYFSNLCMYNRYICSFICKTQKSFHLWQAFLLASSNVFCKSFYFPNLNPVCNSVTYYD